MYIPCGDYAGRRHNRPERAMISGVILRKPPDRATPLRGGPLIMYITKKAVHHEKLWDFGI